MIEGVRLSEGFSEEALEARPPSQSPQEKSVTELDLPTHIQVTEQRIQQVISNGGQIVASTHTRLSETTRPEALKHLVEDQLSEISKAISTIDNLCNPKAFDSVMSKIGKVIDSLSHIYSEDGRLRDIDTRVFEEYDIDTPHALKERKCDELVETILDAYGHKNKGEYLEDRRNKDLSRWKSAYVPPAVASLVSKRFVKSDSNLDADHVTPTLRLARKEINEHCELQNCRALRKLFDDGKIPTPRQILQVAADEGLGKDSPLLIALSVNLNDINQKKVAIDTLLPLKTPLVSLADQINALVSEKQAILEAEREARNEILLREHWDAAFRNERSLRNALGLDPNAMTEPRKEQVANIVRFATEGGKDLLAEILLDRSLPNSEKLAKAFVQQEAEAIGRTIEQDPENALDECLARFPRLAYLSLANREKGETPPLYAELLDTLAEHKLFPAWMLSWRAYLNEQMAAGRVVAIDVLTENCAAFGRFKGQEIPFSAALGIDADKMRREDKARNPSASS